MINIEGLEKSKVLAALYNASEPMGLGTLHWKSGDMSERKAKRLLKKHTYNGRIYFGYLNGRVMKVDLTSDVEFDEYLYDRDNGLGAAQMAIDKLRK